MTELYKQEGYDLMAAAFEVYNEKGHGFLEEVYQECLEIELGLRDIPYKPQPELPIYYKDRQLEKFYRPDLYVYDGIVAELKAVQEITDDHIAQIMNYLHATKKSVGYLINFGHSKELQWQRLVVN